MHYSQKHNTMAITDTLAYYLENFGIIDFFLPFIIVFTIVFAVLQKAKILGEPTKVGKMNAVIALVLGLLFVVPHVTGTYPSGYDPVQIMNEALPGISLVGIAVIFSLILLGIFGKKYADTANPLIAILAVGFVGYIFGSSLGWWRGPYDVFSWWTTETTELMIIVAIFAVIVWLITKKEGTGFLGGAKKGYEALGKLIENIKPPKPD
ncbi:MAG TPA: hypothetical protein VJC21_00775 [Candidatus Nanoarchaeia archaeon]|nr:hypothetical protein [Candidatus Nanoarchaeia archaeon]